MTKPDLTHRQLGTVLAALRFWQLSRENGTKIPGPIADIASDEEALLPLDGDEIDKLCEDLNTR